MNERPQHPSAEAANGATASEKEFCNAWRTRNATSGLAAFRPTGTESFSTLRKSQNEQCGNVGEWRLRRRSSLSGCDLACFFTPAFLWALFFVSTGLTVIAGCIALREMQTAREFGKPDNQEEVLSTFT